MTYSTIVEMANSESMIARVAAAAVEEGFKDDPMSFARNMIWQVVSAPEWDSQWEYAQSTYTINANPDTGARTDVITDEMILAVVQPLVNPPPPPPPDVLDNTLPEPEATA